MTVKVRPSRGGKGWEYDILFRWPDGSRFRERANAPVTGKSAAVRWAAAREASLLAGGKEALAASKAPPPRTASAVTLAEFWPRVLQDHYRASRKKPSTIDAAETIFRLHLAPVHGKSLSDIGPAEIAALKGGLSASSAKTVNNVLSVLSRILRCAVDWNVLTAKPRIQLLKTADPNMAWYEVEDYRRLVEASKYSRRVHLLVLLGGSAGMRRGEIIALKWTDVDLERAFIRIERAMWRKEEGTTKGGRYRIVPMTPQLLDVLKAHRHLGERVLYNDDSRELSNRTIRNWLARAQRKASLPDDGGIHILRHTFCSHLAAAGVPAKAIQELAGHADLKTTLRYMHLSPGDRGAAMAVLAAYHSGVSGVKTVRKAGT